MWTHIMYYIKIGLFDLKIGLFEVLICYGNSTYNKKIYINVSSNFILTVF